MEHGRPLPLVMIPLVLLLHAGRIDTAQTPRVSIDVYYESMCPYSIDFITKQLWPTYQTLGNYMNVRLYPYGNARTVASKDMYGKITDVIYCQHGQSECLGNTVQCCALDALRGNSRDQLEFVACMMSSHQPYQAGRHCAEEVCLPWDRISKCALGLQGKMLLKEAGRMTQLLVPPMSSVPHIVINGQHTGYYTGRARSNLKSLVCELLQQEPAACKV